MRRAKRVVYKNHLFENVRYAFFYNKKALIAYAMRAGYWVGIDLLSRGIYRSTIGAGRLNCSVRNGKR